MKKIIIMLLFFNPVFGQGKFYVDGNTLLKMISHNKDIAMTYIYGSIDTFSLMESANSIPPKYCLPNNLNDGNQMVMVVEKYLRQNPEELHHAANILVSLAFREAFPCR